MKTKIVLLLILLLALVLRTIRISSVPLGIRNDEAYIFVNGYTISQTGQDIYKTPFPLVFRPHSGITTTPVPIYLDAFMFKLFGYSIGTAKLPTILFSLLGIYVTFLFIRELLKDERVALAASFVLAVSPWYVYVSRTGFEAVIAYTAVMAGFYFLLLSIKKGVSPWPSILCFIIASFSYKATDVVLVGGTFVFGIFAYILNKNRKISVLVFIATTILVLFVGWLHINVYKDTYSTGILYEQAKTVVDTVNAERQQSDAPFWLQQVMSNKVTVQAQAIENYYLNFFSLKGLFLPKGSQDDSYSLGISGLAYFFELFVIPFGIYTLLRKSKITGGLMLSLLAIAPLPAVISSPIYPLRCLLGVYILAIFSGTGFVGIWDLVRRRHMLSKIVLMGIGVIYIYSISIFLYQYFYRLPNLGYDVWQTYDMDAYTYVGKKAPNAGKVTVVGVGENEFLQYAFWNHLNARDVQNTIAS